MVTVDLIPLSLEQIEDVRQRVEQYFGLDPGDLASEQQAKKREPVPFEVQDATRPIRSAAQIPSARDQVLYNLWMLIRTAKAAHR